MHNSTNVQWDYISSLFFTGTILTTIGIASIPLYPLYITLLQLYDRYSCSSVTTPTLTESLHTFHSIKPPHHPHLHLSIPFLLIQFCIDTAQHTILFNKVEAQKSRRAKVSYSNFISCELNLLLRIKFYTSVEFISIYFVIYCPDGVLVPFGQI